MDQELILRALKSACGNKNFRFQVIVQDSQLHIYINRKAEQEPNYDFLTNLVTQAIASLNLDSLDSIWLYSRKLGKIEPDWQSFVDLAATDYPDDLDTIATDNNLAKALTDLESNQETQTSLSGNWNSFNDKPVKKETINQSVNLNQYCFVTNKKLLTSETIPPDKQTIRLVKFFHYLSEDNKAKILPALDIYFRSAEITSLDTLSVGVQKWFRQITQLNYEDGRVVALWLSRYCFDSDATLADFKIINEKADLAKVTKKGNLRATSINTKTRGNSNHEAQLNQLHRREFSLLAVIKKFLLPLIWISATLLLLIWGIYTNNGLKSATVASICKNTIGSSNYCHLAVNLVGANSIKRTPKNIFPLTSTTAQAAILGCQRYANFKAGIKSELDPKQTPVTFSYGEKVFPHIYIVEAQQKNWQKPGNVKVGCVYTIGQKERSPKLIAADVIPLNWASQAYQKPRKFQSNYTFGIYTHLINLGLYTIFSAIGIAIACQLNLGIQVNHSQAIYLLALFLGIVQLIAGELPMLNLFSYIGFSTLTIVSSNFLLKSVQINWNVGYPLVTIGVLTIIAIQSLLYGLSLKLINLI